MSKKRKIAIEPVVGPIEAAEILGIHPRTLARMAIRGEVPFCLVGKRRRYRASDLERIAATRGSPPKRRTRRK